MFSLSSIFGALTTSHRDVIDNVELESFCLTFESVEKMCVWIVCDDFSLEVSGLEYVT